MNSKLGCGQLFNMHADSPLRKGGKETHDGTRMNAQLEHDLASAPIVFFLMASAPVSLDSREPRVHWVPAAFALTTGKPVFVRMSIARSIGICATPALRSTHP